MKAAKFRFIWLMNMSSFSKLFHLKSGAKFKDLHSSWLTEWPHSFSSSSSKAECLLKLAAARFFPHSINHSPTTNVESICKVQFALSIVQLFGSLQLLIRIVSSHREKLALLTEKQLLWMYNRLNGWINGGFPRDFSLFAFHIDIIGNGFKWDNRKLINFWRSNSDGFNRRNRHEFPESSIWKPQINRAQKCVH